MYTIVTLQPDALDVLTREVKSYERSNMRKERSLCELFPFFYFLVCWTLRGMTLKLMKTTYISLLW